MPELDEVEEETMEKQAIPPYMDYDVRTEETMEVTYNIEFADNGMVVRSFDSVTVTEGNERRMSEEIGKLVYAEMTQLMYETRTIKLTIKAEKDET